MAALIAVPMAGVAERNFSGDVAAAGNHGDVRHEQKVPATQGLL
jgi:hypothetical protein